MTKYALLTWSLIYFALVGPITISANNDQTVVMGLFIGLITAALDLSYIFSFKKEPKV